MTWEAPAQPSVWEPARPYEQAHDDDADDRDSGPATDPDLPRVPADAADLSRPPSFWDTAGAPPAASPSAAPAAISPAASRVSGDEPDATWDERPHQTLVWGAAHQRAKATRIQEQDEADQDAARQDEDGQDAPGPAGYDAPAQRPRAPAQRTTRKRGSRPAASRTMSDGGGGRPGRPGCAAPGRSALRSTSRITTRNGAARCTAIRRSSNGSAWRRSSPGCPG